MEVGNRNHQPHRSGAGLLLAFAVGLREGWGKATHCRRTGADCQGLRFKWRRAIFDSLLCRLLTVIEFERQICQHEA